MRTTITLDPDVAAAVAKVQAEEQVGVSKAVNDLVRRGLAAVPQRRRFVQTTSNMGPPMLPLDNIGELLEVLEGPAHR